MLCKWHKRRLEAKTPKPLKRTPLKKSSTPIRKESVKRAKQNKKYSEIRKRILAVRTICECGRVDSKGNICNRPATTIHHPEGRIGELLTDEDNMIALSFECHVWVETHPEEAKKLGLSKRRTTQIKRA